MDAKDDDLLTIGAIAQRSGVNASALRYYESLGLMSRCATMPVIGAFAAPACAGWLTSCLPSVWVFSWRKLPRSCAAFPSTTRLRVKTWLARVDERINEMTRLRQSLASCVGCGCLSMKVCRVYNRNDCIAQKGPGPRLWLGDSLTPTPDEESAP